MTRKLVLIAAAALVLALLTAGIAVAAGNRTDDATSNAATAQSDDETGEAQDTDENLSGTPAERAADAALATTDGGTVLEVEAGDDPGASYEVEIRTPNGGDVEVLLDANFNVVDSVSGDDD